MKHFHHFINPGEVNYSSKTVEYTVNRIHGIDSTMYSDGDDNYLKIYKEICKFVNTPEKIVIAKDKTLDEKCFQFLLSKIGIVFTYYLSL
jgi:hypothetical protein